MLTVRKITEFDDFLKIKGIWDRLLTESGINNPFLTHDWFKIAFEYFENRNNLYILLVHEEDKVIAIVPFLISNDRYYSLLVRKIRFLENVHTPFQDFILAKKKKESLEAIFDFLQDNFNQWDLIELKEMRSNSKTIPLLARISDIKKIFRYDFLISRSWLIPTNISWEEGLTKLRPKVRREFKRKIRRIEGLGELSLQMLTEPEEIERHLDIFFKFYEQSWKGKEQNAEFYYEIARKFSPRKEFVLFCLCINASPIAYTFVLKTKNTLFCLKTTFDPSYQAFSSGGIMFYKIFEYCFNHEDIDEFDLGRGDEHYKQDFECHPKSQINLILGHRRTFVSYLFFVRFKLVLLIKSKKLLAIILSSLQKCKKFLKNIHENIATKKNIFTKSKRDIVYIRKLSGIKSEVKNTGWQCEKADLDDMDYLAIAMKVKRLAYLKERLLNNECLFISKDEKKRHYFWFSQNFGQNGNLKVKDDQIILTDFDPLVFEEDTESLLQIFNKIYNILIDRKFKVLYVVSGSDDEQKKELFESLNFQLNNSLKRI